jgi:hypothetical protein
MSAAPDHQTVPPVTQETCCPLCRGELEYLYWPIDSFICRHDSAWWSLAEALDRRSGHREHL